MKSYLYLTNCDNAMIVYSKYPKSFNDAILITSKEGRIHGRHQFMLNQFKMSNGLYMLSEQLLMVVSRSFQIDYEDLWNHFYMRSDRSDHGVVRTKRTNTVGDDCLSDLGIIGDQGS